MLQLLHVPKMMWCSGICSAKEQELILAPGLGDKKVKRLYQALHEPFRNVKQRFLSSCRNENSVNIANKSHSGSSSSSSSSGSNSSSNSSSSSSSCSNNSSSDSSSIINGTDSVQQSILVNNDVTQNSVSTTHVTGATVDEKS